eukprot:jgi/Astpho2/4335/Aster-07424
MSGEKSYTDQASEALGQAGQTIKETARSAQDTVTGATNDAKSKTGQQSTTDKISDTVGQKTQETKHAAKNTANQ